MSPISRKIVFHSIWPGTVIVYVALVTGKLSSTLHTQRLVSTLTSPAARVLWPSSHWRLTSSRQVNICHGLQNYSCDIFESKGCWLCCSLAAYAQPVSQRVRGPFEWTTSDSQILELKISSLYNYLKWLMISLIKTNNICNVQTKENLKTVTLTKLWQYVLNITRGFLLGNA